MKKRANTKQEIRWRTLCADLRFASIHFLSYGIRPINFCSSIESVIHYLQRYSWPYLQIHRKKNSFLVATIRLYKRVRPSVGAFAPQPARSLRISLEISFKISFKISLKIDMWLMSTFMSHILATYDNRSGKIDIQPGKFLLELDHPHIQNFTFVLALFEFKRWIALHPFVLLPRDRIGGARLPFLFLFYFPPFFSLLFRCVLASL